MGQKTTRIFIVEDDLSHAEAIRHYLVSSDDPVDVAVVDTLRRCREEIAAFNPDILLLDLHLPDGQSLQFLKSIVNTDSFPILLMTALGNEALAVEAIKAGALDYIVKSPESFAAMPRIVERSLREFRAQRDHHEALLALQESEQRFRTLLQDVGSVAVQGYHADGTVFYWNKASEALYGYTSEEALGQHLCDLIIPEAMRPQVYAAIDTMTRTCQPTPAAELSLRHKDGSEVVVYSSHGVNCLPNRPPEIYCIDIDIKEQKLNERVISSQLHLSHYSLNHNLDELLQEFLSEAERLTNSCIGFFHFVEADHQSLHLQTWSRNTMAHLCKTTPDERHYPISAAGVWADCVRVGAPVIHNDYEQLAVRKGLPPGHAPIIRELVVPVYRDESIVAVFGVGNKPVDYGNQDIEIIQKLADMSWDLVIRKQAEVELRKLSFAIEQSPVAVVITDLAGRIEYINPKFTEATGYTASEAVGKNPRLLKSGTVAAEEYEELWKTITLGNEWSGEFLNKHKDGRLFWEKAMIAPLVDEQGTTTHYIGIKEDITVQKSYEQQLEYQATHDQLTGLTNRFLLKDRLEQAIQYAQRSKRLVALVLLDLDRFKVVNDSLGHAMGDELLCKVAARLKKTVRDTDTVARFGGDEFVLLLTQIARAEDVTPVLGKITKAFSTAFHLDNRRINLSVSMGISLSPLHSEDSDNLIRFADMAMYKAKNSGQDYCFYDMDMGRFGLDALELEHDMYQALEHGQFLLHYQPKISLKTGLVDGCEALLRWQHPERGMISPGQFIPIAEQTGLIVPIGRWVIEEACRQSLAWQANGMPPVCIAVNLSARQFRQGDLAATVRRALLDFGLEPALLELELTESMIMDDPENARVTLQDLKQLGVALSLDDFGTGYSSLNYLRRFPVDSLKIDQSFIGDSTTDPSGASVVTSIIDIAHNLGLIAIAEGVETQDQLNFLCKNGCDAVQGFLFSKPLPASEFAGLLQESKRWPVRDQCRDARTD